MKRLIPQGLIWAIVAVTGVLMAITPRTPDLVTHPDLCPDTWNRQSVGYEEREDGYQCVANLFDPEEGKWHTVPVGEISAPPTWMGWALLAVAGIGFFTSANWARFRSAWDRRRPGRP